MATESAQTPNQNITGTFARDLSLLLQNETCDSNRFHLLLFFCCCLLFVYGAWVMFIFCCSSRFGIFSTI